MAKKKSRAKKTSSGARKNWIARNHSRRTPVDADPATVDFLKHQASNRWPTEESMIKRSELEKDKQANQPARGRIKQPDLGFPLMEQAMGDWGSHKQVTIKKLLVAASLKIKSVKRYPNWVLQRTYNLGKRPLEFV